MLFGSKKVKKEKVGEDVGFDSILDLDADMDDLGLGASNARSKLKNFNTGFHRGFNSDINRKHVLNGLMAGALPNEYAHLYRTGMDAQRVIREDVRHAREANADVLLSMVERTERLLPKLRRFTPKRVYARFEENLAKSRESLSAEVDSKRQREQGTTSNDGDENTIRDALLDVTAYSDARNESREQDNYLKESAQRTLQAEIERTRFGTTTEQLGNIAGNLERQNAFQDSITYRFQRKSLEVQYRSLFMLRDLRKLTGANLDLQRRGFEALVHNTGLTNSQLPQHAIRNFKNDHLTTLAKEAGIVDQAPAFSYGNAVRQGLTFGVTTSAREKLPQFLSNYTPEIRKRIQRSIAGILSGMDTTADIAEANGEMNAGLNGDDRANMGGQGIGGVLGKLFGTYVAPRMGRFARPGLERMNGNLGGRGHLASYWINNLPSILQDFSRNQSSEDSSLMGMLRGGVRALTPTYYREDELEDGSYQTIDREVGFNHLSQRSLVEVIPGYLSRMLHEARMLRTGDTTIDREVYDVTKGMFTTTKGARQSLRDRIVPEGQRNNVTSTLDSIMSTYMGDDTLSDEAKFALREQLMQDAGSGGRFDPEKYASGGFNSDTPDATVQELTDFFKRQFDFDDNGKLVKEYRNLKQLDDYAQEFSRLRDIMPDPREEISRLHGAGSQELMRDLGIIYSRNGRDYTDFSQVWKMYRGDDDVIGEDEAPLPNQPPSANRSSMSYGSGIVDDDTIVKFNDHLVQLFANTQQHLNDAMNRVSEKLCDHPIFYEKCCSPCDDPKRRRKAINAMRDQDDLSTEDETVGSDIHKVDTERKVASAKPQWINKVQDSIRARKAQVRPSTDKPQKEESLPKGRFRGFRSEAKTKVTNARDVLRHTYGKADDNLSPRHWFSKARDAVAPDNVTAPFDQPRPPEPGTAEKPTFKENKPKTADQPSPTMERTPDDEVIFINRQGVGSTKKQTRTNSAFRDFYTKVTEKEPPLSKWKGYLNSRTERKVNATKPETSTPHRSNALNDDPKTTGFRDFHQRAKDKLSDLFTRRGDRTLLKRDLIAGLYIDKKSQKVIYDVKDIHGEVTDRDGNVILTEVEWRDGLFNITNTPVKERSHANSFLGTDPTKKGKIGEIKETLTNLRDRVKQANNARMTIGKKMGDLFHHDAYMPGEETPRIRIAAIKDGAYTNRKGTVIRRISDIRGSIFDKDLNVVVSEDELKHLLTIQGKPHPIAKNTSGLNRIISKGAQIAGKYLDWSKNYYKKLPGRLLRTAKGITKFTGGAGRLLSSPIKTTLGLDEETPTIMGGIKKRSRQAARAMDIGMNDGRNLNPTMVNSNAPHGVGGAGDIDPRDMDWVNDDDEPVDDDAIKTPTDGLLNRINETLERAYPDPHRKGSWQQILADRKAKREAEAKADAADKGDDKPSVNVFDQLKGMFGGLKDVLAGVGGSLFGDVTAVGNPLGGGRDGSGRNKPKKGGWFKRAAQAAGKWGWLGAAFLGKGALALGTAAVTTVGLPIIAGTAAVAGIVGGGIYLWNRHQETSGKLYRWRFAQYGIDPVNRDEAIPVLALEKHIEEITVRNGPNDITVDGGKLDVEQVTELFGLADADQERIDEWNRWYEGRFIPIYLAHQRALVTLAPSVKLTEIDGELDKEDGRDFIEAVVVPSEMLSINASPFGPDHPLSMTTGAIKDYKEGVLEEYDVSRATRNIQRRNAGPGSGHRETQRTVTNDPVEQASHRQRQRRNRNVPAVTPELTTTAINAAKKVVDTELHSNIAVLLNLDRPSPLQAVRLHGYGLDNLDSHWVTILLTLETKVFEYISINKEHQAVFKGNANTHLREVADLLGVVWSEDREETQKWRFWFVSRFLPVLLAYASRMHNTSPATALGNSGSSLSKEQRLSVARAIIGAQTLQQNEMVPVWDVVINVFPESDNARAERKALLISRQLEEDAHKTETPLGHSPEAARQRQQNRREMEKRVTQGGSNTPPPTNQWDEFKSQALGTGGSNTSPLPPGGQAGARGNVYGGFAEGNGGAWEELPLPSKDADRAAAMPTLQGVEEMTGVDANLLATFAKIESNFRSQVKADTSSATGWFQFLNATWDEMIEKHGAKYGIPTNLPEFERRELRKDPRINALMGAEFLKGNHAYLSRHINREPTDADLYLAHFLGMGGAKKLLTADVNTRADRLFEDPAKSNPTVFYHGGDRSRPRTIGDMIQWADTKVAPGRVAGGGSNVFSSTTPDSATQAPTPQVDVSGVTAMAEREVVQVAPDGASGAYQFADESDAAREVSEHLAQSNQARRSVPGIDPASNNTPSPVTTPQRDTFQTVEEEVAEIVQPQQQRRQQVMETERRQRVRLEESAIETQAMGTIAQQQLDTQREMRDYLMQMAESMGIIQDKGLKMIKEEESDRPSNDTSVPPSSTPSRQRQTGNANAPVSMTSP